MDRLRTAREQLSEHAQDLLGAIESGSNPDLTELIISLRANNTSGSESASQNNQLSGRAVSTKIGSTFIFPPPQGNNVMDRARSKSFPTSFACRQKVHAFGECSLPNTPSSCHRLSLSGRCGSTTSPRTLPSTLFLDPVLEDEQQLRHVYGFPYHRPAITGRTGTQSTPRGHVYQTYSRGSNSDADTWHRVQWSDRCCCCLASSIGWICLRGCPYLEVAGQLALHLPSLPSRWPHNHRSGYAAGLLVPPPWPIASSNKVTKSD